MANVKNFGLIGVGSDLQFGKAGTRLVNNAGVFNFKASNGSTDAALTTAGITSSAGNITLTTGNLVATAGDLVATAGNVVLSSNSGVVTLGDAGSIGRAATGVYSFSGTGAMIVPKGTTGQQTAVTAGSFRYNTTTSLMEFANGTVWTPVGNTAPLQTEIDKIEAALGASIDSSGDFINNFTGAAFSSPTTFTQAIQQVANYAIAHDTLDEIFPQSGAGNVIYSSGGVWAQDVPGATSGVQAYDTDLAALAATVTTGMYVVTGSGTSATRTLTAPAAGLTITNANGVAGNPTFALANDLAALEGLATTGLIVRTGDGTATTRTITGTAGRVTVTDGSAVGGDPTIDLATVTDSGTGAFLKIAKDGYGRVTGTEAVVAADITTLVDGTYVNVAGDTMTGNLSFGGTFKATNLAEPTASSDAATKNYVDNAVTGLSWKQAVHVLSATNVDIATGGLLTIDGHTLIAGDRVLLTGQTTGSENGIYDAAVGAWTRSSDANVYTELNGAAVFVQQGTVYADTGWTQTATLTSFSGQSWSQFSGAGSYSAGDGLLLTGTVFSVNMGAGITTLPSDEVGLDIVTGKAVQLTSTATGGQLDFVLDGAGLEQSAAGLKISAAGVTNAMLANSGFSATADSGSDTLSLGNGLHIHGVSTQGTSVSVADNPAGTTEFIVTAADASASQKGVAKFTTGEFVVTAGNVALGTVANSNLANSTITFTGDTGSEAVALGESFDFNGDSTYITTAVSGNVVSLTLGTVDVPHGGTGLTSLTAGYIPFGAGTAALANTADFTFSNGATVDTLAIGGASGLTLSTNSASSDVVLTALGTNGDIVAVPNGTGSFIVGVTGAGLIQSDAAQALTVRGNTTLTLESGTGSTSMVLVAGTGQKVNISGPSAVDYATGLADNSLTNKKYVDTAIATGASAGSIKAVSATVSLLAAASHNIGAALPAGATILSVKVKVTTADTATGTLIVGKSGGSEYMTASENDTQTVGMYIAEDMVTEASSEQVTAVVAGTPGGSGSATIVVTYQVAA